jgi:hypothetical protein
MKYEVIISASMRTSWESKNKEEVLRMAEDWVAQEYGDLVHKADFEIKEVNAQ